MRFMCVSVVDGMGGFAGPGGADPDGKTEGIMQDPQLRCQPKKAVAAIGRISDAPHLPPLAPPARGPRTSESGEPGGRP